MYLRQSWGVLLSFARLRATSLGHVVPVGRLATKLKIVDTACSLMALFQSQGAANGHPASY